MKTENNFKLFVISIFGGFFKFCIKLPLFKIFFFQKMFSIHSHGFSGYKELAVQHVKYQHHQGYSYWLLMPEPLTITTRICIYCHNYNHNNVLKIALSRSRISGQHLTFTFSSLQHNTYSALGILVVAFNTALWKSNKASSWLAVHKSFIALLSACKPKNDTVKYLNIYSQFLFSILQSLCSEILEKKIFRHLLFPFA